MTPRYKLRTLLILLAILPPLLWFGWGKYEAWRGEEVRQRALRGAAPQTITVDSIITQPQSDLQAWSDSVAPGKAKDEPQE
jgi:hypothetical protein